MMTSSSSSEEPLELGRSASPEYHRGNLALCRHDVSGIQQCLGKSDEEEPVTSRSSGGGVDDDGAVPATSEPPEPKLNWRYENGLLRSVDPNGVATNLCLGPSDRVKVLDGTAGEPYRLVLEDCPHIPGRKDNIFVHPLEPEETTTTTTSAVSTVGAAANARAAASEQPTKSYARHMQFLVQADGCVQSLAPVFDDPKDPGDDLVAEKPFCITIMKWGEDAEPQAYLVPCHREGETEIESNSSSAEAELLERIQPRQQVFDTERGSAFDSFLLDLNSKDTDYLQLAYQIGFSSVSSPSLSDKNNYEDFESIVIRVVTTADAAEGGGDEPSELVTERIVTSVWANNERQSGIVSYKLSSLSGTGRMEAHLMGRSMGGLETTWLASTSFEVPKPFDPFPNGWTWSLLVFTSIMACYVVYLKVSYCFCPSSRRRKRSRNSELTAVTSNSNHNNSNNNSDLDWGIVPTIDVLLPNRISEEEGSSRSSSNSSRSRRDITGHSVYDTTADLTDDRDSTLDSEDINDNDGGDDDDDDDVVVDVEGQNGNRRR